MPLDFTGNAPILMGIVNVTPDSFSDGGKYLQTQKAIDHALKLRDEGALILDIGGESTRPGAAPVSVQEEQDRVIPVVDGLKNSGVLVSVDTRNAKTMAAAISAGAGMINDVSALTHDPLSLSTVAGRDVYVCLMHMKGTPETMQASPHYDNVVEDVRHYLANRVKVCMAAGVKPDRILLDPGIGLGKTLEDNLRLLNHLDKFMTLNAPLLLGASRKRFIEGVCPATPANERLGGSIAAVLSAYAKGVRVFRVHDVAQTKQALDVFRAIECA